MRKWLSMEGRCNRTPYFWTVLAIVVAGNILLFVLGRTGGAFRNGAGSGYLLGQGIVIPTAVLAAVQIVRRLHDLDRPGTHYWLLLVPVYNIYLGLVLLFKKGTVGPNRYGPDPLNPGIDGAEHESQSISTGKNL